MNRRSVFVDYLKHWNVKREIKVKIWMEEAQSQLGKNQGINELNYQELYQKCSEIINDEDDEEEESDKEEQDN